MKLQPVTTKHDVRLDDGHAHVHGHVKSGDALEAAMAKEVERVSELQRVLYADARYAVLIVLQGRDASGKDGTVKRVFREVNPQGCFVTSFKVPTEEDQSHDFLWRVHQRVPPKRMIGIFNRSHYEDVIVTRARKLLPKKVISKRFEQINDFERMLTENSVVVLKFFLHVSRDEQKKRLNERLEDRKKNWKFRLGDLEDRKMWDYYTKAYRAALLKCSTKWAPWYIVPADDEAVRNLLVARKIADTLDSLDLEYPPLDPELKGVKVE